MPISIKVTGARGAAMKLAKLAITLKGGAKSISSPVVRKIVEIVVIHDTRNFRSMQQERAKNKISLPAAIFSRVVNYIGREGTSIRRIEAKVDRLLPLADTKRLYNSISNADSPDVKIVVTVDSISVINLVPYAPKHMTGISLVNINVYDLFEFGATEQQRLRERVPPPPLKGKRQKEVVKKRNRDIVQPAFFEAVGGVREPIYNDDNELVGYRVVGAGRRLLFREEERGDLKSSRPYYRLYNWAKNKYPTTGALPKRNWLYPLPPEATQLIGQLILSDLMERNGL